MGTQNFYCEDCGKPYPSVQQLTNGLCPRHPDGSNRGKHKLYEGGEKKKYTCKHCGKEYPTIAAMVIGPCPRHPKGSNHGKHAPAL